MVLLHHDLGGQSTRFEHVTTYHGLSQNSVVDIVQDSYGFIWLATQDGLNRFDGTDFVHYPKYFRDITRTTYTQLGHLYHSTKNELWLSTVTGDLQILDISEEEFSENIDVKDASVILKEDSTYWVGTYGHGIYEIGSSNKRNSKSSYLQQRQIYDVVKIDEKLLVATDQGLFVLVNQSFEAITSVPQTLSISSLEVFNDQIILGTHANGLYAYDDESVIQLKWISRDAVTHDLLSDKAGNLWIATFGLGAYRVNKDLTIDHFTFDEQDPFSINYDDVLCLMEDKQGNIWLGTDGGGVSIYSKKRQRIKSISRNQLPKEYPVDVVRAIATDKRQNIWIGTSGKGLTKISKGFDQKVNYNTQSQIAKLSSNRIVSLKMDENDLWIGYQEGGIEKLNTINGVLAQYPSLDFIETIWDIEIDHDGILWLATRNNGIIRFDNSTNDVKILSQYVYGESFPSNNIRDIEITEKNQLIFGTEEGKVFRLFDHDNIEQISLTGIEDPGQIKSLYYKEFDNILWAGTQRSGLLRVDLKTNQVIDITTDNGLPNNTVYAILPDDQGHLWLSTNDGLCQIDVNIEIFDSEVFDRDYSLVVQKLSRTDGLVSDEFNTGAYHKDENGILYFGAIDGVNYFDPKEMNEKGDSLDLMFTDLAIFNNDSITRYPLFDTKEILLSSKEKDFQISFSTSGSSDNTHPYEYRLLNLQENWTVDQKGNVAHFTNVPPGEYIFQLKKANNNINQGHSMKEVQIIINPPWWSTVWFRILSFLVVIIGITLLVRARTNYIRNREAKKYQFQKQLNDLEIQVLRAQMNPHFMFNSLNTIKNYILKSQPKEAAEYLSNFSHLIRQILQNSRQTSISLREELDALILYIDLEKLRFRDGFDFHLFVGENVDLDEIQIPPLIIQPFVENAIWHGLLHKNGERSLSLKILKDNGSCKILIEDNGVGRQKAFELKSKSVIKYKSLGMGITKSRIELNNKMSDMGIEVSVDDLINNGAMDKGTRVSLLLNLNSKTRSSISKNEYDESNYN